MPVARHMLFAGLMGLATMVAAQVQPAHVQMIPILGVRQGPMNGVGVPMADGFIDYLAMLNQRDGGINGIRLAWEECETFFDAGRTLDCYEFQKRRAGGSVLVALPFSTEQFHALLEPTERDQVPVISMSAGRADASDGLTFPFAFTVPINYWSQNTAKLAFIGQRAGGMDKLRGLRIVNVYHDSEFGRATMAVLARQAERYGFSVRHLPVAPSGENLREVWAQVKASEADWVILRGTAAITGAALREAQSAGVAREKIVGTHTTCARPAMVAAGPAATGFTCALWHGTERDMPVVQDILEHVYGRGAGAGPRDDVGTENWLRGVVRALIVTEGMRVAMTRFGVTPLTGSQLKWGLEHLNLTAESLRVRGAQGLLAPLALTCRDHEGGGGVKFRRWDGSQWQVLTDWMAADPALVRPLMEAAARRPAHRQPAC